MLIYLRFYSAVDNLTIFKYCSKDNCMKYVLVIIMSIILLFGCAMPGAPPLAQPPSVPGGQSSATPTPEPVPQPTPAPVPQSVPEPAPQPPPPKEEVKYNTYNAEGFSILYPDGWGIEDEWIMFISPKESENDLFLELFTVKTWESSETLEDLETDEKSFIGESAKFTKSERIKFKGYDAIRLEGDFLPGSENSIVGGSGNEHFTTIFFRIDKVVYRFRYTIEKGKEKRYLPFVNHAIDTLKVGPDASKAPKQPSSGYIYFAGSRFSIEYPSAWTKRKDPSLRFVADKENESDPVLEDVIIEYWESNATLDDMEKEEKSVLYENETFEKVERIEFKGYPAVLFRYEGSLYPESGEKQHYTVTRFKKDNLQYRIGYVWETVPGNTKEKFEPIFKKMIESFKFN